MIEGLGIGDYGLAQLRDEGSHQRDAHRGSNP